MWPIPSGERDAVDLDADAHGEGACLDRGARGVGGLEEARVNFVHGVEVPDVGEIDVALDHAVRAGPRRLQDGHRARVVLLYPLYVTTVVLWTLRWIWDESNRYRTFTQRAGGSLVLLAATPVYVVRAWGRARRKKA